MRAIARWWFRANGELRTVIRGNEYRTDPYHIGFWRDVAGGRWEPELFDLLDRYLHPGAVFVDIGAWIGPAAIYAAGKCENVYCLEPDPDAYQYLLWNLRLNGLGNVTPFNLALSDRSGLRRLSSPDGRLGDSKSTLLEERGRGVGVDVLCMRWDEWMGLAAPGRIDLIKIDIEGGEFTLIPTMREYLRREAPTLLLSLHAPLIPETSRERELDNVLDAIRHYATIQDETGNRIGVDELRGLAMTRLCSVLLSKNSR